MGYDRQGDPVRKPGRTSAAPSTSIGAGIGGLRYMLPIATMTTLQIDMPDDIASELLQRAPEAGDRVRLVESIFREYFARHQQDEDDLGILNTNADELNGEAEDVLEYQVYLEER
jgi:hypothetical protein